jgi:C1A family cysteine protease
MKKFTEMLMACIFTLSLSCGTPDDERNTASYGVYPAMPGKYENPAVSTDFVNIVSGISRTFKSVPLSAGVGSLSARVSAAPATGVRAGSAGDAASDSLSEYKSAAITPAKNQGAFNTCWTFAANAAAEAYYILKYGAKNPDFSEIHMAYAMSGDLGTGDASRNEYGHEARKPQDSGQFPMAAAYWLRDKLGGAVAESAMPAADPSSGKTAAGLSSGKPAAGLSSGKTAADPSSGNPPAGLSSGKTAAGLSSGKPAADPSSGKTAAGLSSGKPAADPSSGNPPTGLSSGKTAAANALPALTAADMDKPKIGKITDVLIIPDLPDADGKKLSAGNNPAYRSQIQSAVRKNGSVMFAYHSPVSTATDLEKTTGYGDAGGTKTYFNTKNAEANHAAVIVGWDDNYPKENFTDASSPGNTPPADGAWLVKNSWGEDWSKMSGEYEGFDGCFWMSYYTPLSQTWYINGYEPDYKGAVFTYTPLEINNKFWQDGSQLIFSADIYDNTQPSGTLESVSFFACDANADYDVYAAAVDIGSVSDNDLIMSAIKNPGAKAHMKTQVPGYYTVELDKPLDIAKKTFITVIRNRAATGNASLATSSDVNNKRVEPGQSYISANGIDWYDCGREAGANVQVYANVKDCAGVTDGTRVRRQTAG